MQQHTTDVKNLHNKGRKSDSYAKHFAEQFKGMGKGKLTPGMQRDNRKCEILWRGNPISMVKTFGTRICSLCNRERLEILKRSRKDSNSIINSCNEIYGACRHKPKLHWYIKQNTSTDESEKDERIAPTKVTTEVGAVCSPCKVLTEV